MFKHTHTKADRAHVDEHRHTHTAGGKAKACGKGIGDAPLHHPEQHVGYKCKVGGAEVLDRDAPRVAQRAHDLRKVWPNDKDQHPSPQPVPQ